MRAYHVTNHARRQLAEIVDFIAADNLDAAIRYYEAALGIFTDFPADIVTPRPASERLPSNVLDLHVRDFPRYTLRILVNDAEVFLLCAFRPGLPDELKDSRKTSSLRSL